MKTIRIFIVLIMVAAAITPLAAITPVVSEAQTVLENEVDIALFMPVEGDAPARGKAQPSQIGSISGTTSPSPFFFRVYLPSVVRNISP